MFGSESSIQPRGLELVPEHPLRRHCLLWRPALRRCCREERCRHCGSEPPSTGWHRDCIWRRGWVPRESRGRWTRAPSQGHSRWKPGCLFVALLVLALPLLLNSAGIPGAPPPACATRSRQTGLCLALAPSRLAEHADAWKAWHGRRVWSAASASCVAVVCTRLGTALWVSHDGLRLYLLCRFQGARRMARLRHGGGR